MAAPIKSYSITEIDDLVRKAGLPAFRGRQILEWVYGKGVSSYDEMRNLPNEMRKQLAALYPLFTPKVLVRQNSIDGTKKYLLELFDGTHTETVGMPSKEGRLTVCVSSQAGCRMGCVFCATGKGGFVRNLFLGEIVDQLNIVKHDFGCRVTNVVIMGQGEPFENYDATLSALRIINHPRLLNIGARHITVSTCGIISKIHRFSREPEQFTLAVSLHAARQQVRDYLMPAMRNQRLNELREALIQYTEQTGRRVTLEYAIIKGINDTTEDLEALFTFCNQLLCHINLIPLNEVSYSEFHTVIPTVMNEWKNKLEQNSIPVTIRYSRGSDIDAACGQLVC